MIECGSAPVGPSGSRSRGCGGQVCGPRRAAPARRAGARRRSGRRRAGRADLSGGTHQDQRNTADAIVVLGAAQYNGDPSAVFQARLDHAAELYDGSGRSDRDHRRWPGRGRDHRRRSGPGGADRGRDRPARPSPPSARATTPWSACGPPPSARPANGWTSVVLVTDPWHAHRSQLMARDLGLQARCHR